MYHSQERPLLVRPETPEWTEMRLAGRQESFGAELAALRRGFS